jgi:hypothetical protein
MIIITFIQNFFPRVAYDFNLIVIIIQIDIHQNYFSNRILFFSLSEVAKQTNVYNEIFVNMITVAWNSSFRSWIVGNNQVFLKRTPEKKTKNKNYQPK